MVLFGIKTKTDLQNDLFCLQEERIKIKSTTTIKRRKIKKSTKTKDNKRNII
jgi:hypothetical protein